MKFAYRVPELEARLGAAESIEDLEAALIEVLALGRRLRDPETYGRKLFMPGLDALVPRIARRLRMPDQPGQRSNDRPCIVATQFYGTGGHTRVAMDILRQLGPMPIIYSDAWRAYRYSLALQSEGLVSPMGESATLFLQAGSLVERAIELHMMLKALRPTRIFLLGHPTDPVPVVGCWPFRDVTEFIHHVDLMPMLGATLPFGAHADLNHLCHRHCAVAGLRPTFAGMTAQAPPPRRASDGPRGRRVRIATSGSPHKFQGRRSGYAWTDLVLAALARPDTEIVHIGPAGAELERQIGDALAGAGIGADRYAFTGWTDKVAEELVRCDADLYLASYPEPGGKACVEAFAAELPIILSQDDARPPLLKVAFPVKHWLSVRHPAEMPGAIEAALKMRADIRSPEGRARVAEELDRFRRYVAEPPGLAEPIRRSEAF